MNGKNLLFLFAAITLLASCVEKNVSSNNQPTGCSCVCSAPSGSGSASINDISSNGEPLSGASSSSKDERMLLTRKQAIEEMDGISKKTDLTAEKLTYVKEWKEDNAGTKRKGKETRIYDGSNAVYFADYVEDGVKHEETACIFKTGSSYTFTLSYEQKQFASVSAQSDPDLYATIDDSFGNFVATSIAARIANGLNHAKKDNKYGYCGFLNRFPEDDGIMTGGSFRNDVHIQDERYLKVGEGSISCEYNAVYESQGDEVMKAEWKDYFLVAKSNSKLTSTGYGFETWNYGEGDVRVNTDGYTQLTGTLEIRYLAQVVGTFF